MNIYLYVAGFLVLLLIKPIRVIAGVALGSVLALVGLVFTVITALFSFIAIVITDMSKFLIQGH